MHWRREDRGFSTPCWLWENCRNENDYGHVRIEDGRTRLAHRAVYERMHGVVLPPELELHHRCRVRSCVRPSHMQPVSNTEHNEIHRLDASRAKKNRALVEPEPESVPKPDGVQLIPSDRPIYVPPRARQAAEAARQHQE